MSITKRSNKRIGLMMFPLRNPSEQYGRGIISHLVVLLASLVKEIYLITGNFQRKSPSDNVNIVNVKAPVVTKSKESILSKTFRFFLAQFTLSGELVRLHRKLDVVVLFLSSGLLVLPVLVARIFGKKMIIIVSGSGSQSLRAMYPSLSGRIHSAIMRGIENLDYSLAHKIVVYSNSMVADIGLEKYRHKIAIAPRHFLDFDKFKIQKPLSKRSNLVGYIGRLSEEKGILNFVTAIPEILKERSGAKFLVAGEGRLRDEIDKYLNEENLSVEVKLAGWIPHDKLPDYLNELKLLVLPSYTEGLPNIMLEAMACGTPVLATPVGAIPDVIKDGETGFIMKDNSPECIAKNVLRVLNHLGLEKIARNARALVEREFTYKAAVERYRNILSSFLREH